MRHVVTYITLLHTVTMKIRALISWGQLLYSFDKTRRHDYPVKPFVRS